MMVESISRRERLGREGGRVDKSKEGGRVRGREREERRKVKTDKGCDERRKGRIGRRDGQKLGGCTCTLCKMIHMHKFNCYSLKVGVWYVSYVEPTTGNNVAPSELVNGSAIYNFIGFETITL